MRTPTTAEIADPARRGYDAAIGELLVRLAVGPERPLVTETAELQPQRVQTQANPEDLLQSFGDISSQSDWTGGEGLLNRFRRRSTEADPTRFWSSEGVNVAPSEQGRPEELRLLTTTETVDGISGRVRLAAVGETVWATSGQTIRKTADITADPPVFANDDPHDGEAATTVEDLAVLGDTPYAALGTNGIHRDNGGWDHWSDVAAVRIWSVLDRIVASNGPELFEAAATTTSVLLYTLPPGDEWTEVVDAAGTILASATNGFIYAFALDEAGDLTVAGQTRLKDERPVAMAARADQVFIAATQGEELRLWRGRVEGPGIVDLELLREWFACGCGAMTATRDRILLAVNEDDRTFVWRVELTTSGIFRSNQIGTGRGDGLATVDGRVVAGVRDDGVRFETSQLVEDGYLIGPLNDFFRAENKSWVTGWADVAIAQGEKVSLWYTTQRAALFDPQHPSWRRVTTYATTSSATELPLGQNVVARALAMMVMLERSDANTSPRVRSVAFRSYPGPGDVIVQLPVDVGDQVERHGRRRMPVRGLGMAVAERLRSIEGRALTVTLFRTGENVQGLVERIATPVPAITPRGSVTQMSMVTVRGRRVPRATTLDVGNYGAWGNTQFGAMSWGGQPLEEQT